jgi:hypothetical protein
MKPILLAFALSLAVPAFAHQDIGISDGDTLTLLVEPKPLRKSDSLTDIRARIWMPLQKTR